MKEELLKKILEKLVSIDEKLESISGKLNKPLMVISQEPSIKKSLERTQNVIYTSKKE